MLNDNSLKTERRVSGRRGHEHSKDMSAYRIRPAKEEDCEQIVKLIKVIINKKNAVISKEADRNSRGILAPCSFLPLL